MLHGKESYFEATAVVIWPLELTALTCPDSHTSNLRRLENV